MSIYYVGSRIDLLEKTDILSNFYILPVISKTRRAIFLTTVLCTQVHLWLGPEPIPVGIRQVKLRYWDLFTITKKFFFRLWQHFL